MHARACALQELKGEVNSFEASMKQKQEEQDQAKAEQRAAKQAMADSRARRSAQQQQQYHEAAQTLANQQNAAQEQQAIVQQQQMAAQQAAEQQAAQQQQQQQQQQRAEAAGSSQAELERAIGEAVLGHSSAKSATADLAKLLQPHQQAKAARSAYGQRVKRDQFGVPVITKQDQAKLPGVNVAQWADPRVEREVASSVWRKAHPLNAVEGGSQVHALPHAHAHWGHVCARTVVHVRAHTAPPVYTARRGTDRPACERTLEQVRVNAELASRNCGVLLCAILSSSPLL